MTVPRTFLDVHVLQTVPPSNLNRDDTGSPKTAVYGGVQRARVSSQSWKRAIRKDFEQKLDSKQIGTRTKRVVEAVANEITALAPDTERERAIVLADGVVKAAGIATDAPKPRKGDEIPPVPEAKALAFLSRAQLQALASYAVEAGDGVEAKLAKQYADTDHSVDIALFGRMVASDPSLNVDAACQVAHAISTHAVANEFDYFTAVDDEKPPEESLGAGMVGVIEFNSATLYRYATVDVDALVANLGDRTAAVEAAMAFLSSMVTSMPSGKQNTFANRTLPDVVVVSLRTDQPVSLVGAFEEPVRLEGDSGQMRRSVETLASYAAEVEQMWGRSAERTWVVAAPRYGEALQELAQRTALPEALGDIRAALAALIAAG